LAADVEAFYRRIRLGYLRAQAPQQVIRRRELFRREVEVSRRMPKRQDQRMEIADGRSVPQGEGKLIAEHEPLRVPQRAKDACRVGTPIGTEIGDPRSRHPLSVGGSGPNAS
jgi:hypothetical protein